MCGHVLSFLLSERAVTPPPLGVGSVNSDAMQTLDIEDMDEPKKVSNPPAKAGGLW